MVRKLIHPNRLKKIKKMEDYQKKLEQKESIAKEREEVTSSLNSMESIDDVLEQQLIAIKRLTIMVMKDISLGRVDKDVVQMLSTLNDLTWEYKKKEKEILDSLNDDQLEALVKEE